MAYTVRDIIERIKFYIASQHDLSGKNVNNLFSNKNIVQQLKFAFDKYASYTKAIQSIYSLPVSGDTAVIDEPPFILRGEGIRFLVWFISGFAYPLNENNLNNTYGNFPTVIQGLPKWFKYWDKKITFYPQNSNGFNKTHLAYDVQPKDTVIKVASTNGFPDKCGRITIGSEKIEYENKDATHFYNCTRGIEGTTPAAYDYSSCVFENNVWVYYHRLHFEIPVLSDDTIVNEVLDKEVLINDEHIETICDFAAYKLLSKIDVQRAALYKVNFDEWLENCKAEIIKGRSRITRTRGIRGNYGFESETAFWGM